VNRRKFEKHLSGYGCHLDHHGRRHDIWINQANNTTAPIPRHKTISRGTVRSICRKLDIPLPEGF
jgi:hypothetical protein